MVFKSDKKYTIYKLRLGLGVNTLKLPNQLKPFQITTDVNETLYIL